MHRAHLFLRLMKIPVDFSAAFFGMLVAYWMRQTSDFIPGVQIDVIFIPPFGTYVTVALLASAVYVVLSLFSGMYQLKRTIALRTEALRVLFTVFIWLMTVIAYFFVVREYFFSRLVLLFAAVWMTIFALFGRMLIRFAERALLDRGVGRVRVLILGENDLTKTLQERFTQGRTYRLAGVVPTNFTSLEHMTIDDEKRTFEQILSFRRIEEVVVTKQPTDPKLMSAILTICRQRHVRFRFVPDVMELQLSHIDVEWEQDLPFIELRPTALDGWGRVLKRIMDILGAVFGIVLLSPIWGIAAIALWIERRDPREILFSQNRYGYQGRLFRFYKFQSMRKGAEAEHAKLIEQNQGERKGLLKIKNDPRVTKLGRILRKTSIDELPQLWNVLRGDMSLVGPRPHMPAEIDQLTRDYHRVLCVKPGLTSLAQINGRSNLDFEDEMRLDLTYIDQWSLWLDLVIILRTAWMVVTKTSNVS